MKKYISILMFSVIYMVLLIALPLQAHDSHQHDKEIDLTVSENERLKLRLEAEIEFAEGLCEFHSDQAEDWQILIKEARQILSDLEIADKDAKIPIDRAERLLAPIGEVAKTYTIHCVGHAHIDMNWQWSWPETVSITNDTFITVLKLMDEFPEFHFTQSQASVYEIIKNYNPNLFKKIKEKVIEGRWEIVAAEWVEGDKNMVCGESLARHLLYTRQFVKDNFDLGPEDISICWNPDTFGHAHTIPTILSKGAVKRYYFCRGGDRHPGVFWWQGPDGSRLLTVQERDWYNSTFSLKDAKRLLQFKKETGLKDLMKVYGVGDHGGGPTRRDILRSIEMDSWPIYPNFKMTTTRKYFDLIEKQGDKLPVVDQELNFEFTGCYTSQSQIKKMNRLAECYLQDSESAAVLTEELIGRDWSVDNLKQAWTNTLFGHFHDILPGSGVRWTRQYQSGIFQESFAAANMIMTNSLRSLAGKVDTSFVSIGKNNNSSGRKNYDFTGAGAGRKVELGYVSSASHTSTEHVILVFNPTMYQRNELIKATVWDSARGPGKIKDMGFSVIDPKGNVLKAQKIGSGSYWGHRFVDLTFPVSVASLGYTTYIIRQSSGSADQGQVKPFASFGMENEYIKVDFDPKTGCITSFVDKTNSHDLADKTDPLAALEYILEGHNDMSSWMLGGVQKRISPLEMVSLKRMQKGPFLLSVEAKVKVSDSTITLTYSLGSGQKWLELDLNVNWLERGYKELGIPTLRIQFPFVLADAKAKYEVPFGTIDRYLKNGEEVPSINWASVSGTIKDSNEVAGCTLLNDSKHGHSLDDSTLRLTLIRSSYNPDPLPEMGRSTVRLALAPYAGQISSSDLIKLGKSFNHPLQVVNTDVHNGSLPPKTDSVISVEPKNVLLETIKKAEKGSGVVLRLLETSGEDTISKVKINSDLLGQLKHAARTDLLERPIVSKITTTENSFNVKVPGNSVITIMLDLER